MDTRLVLGLREVLDDPARVRADWDQDAFEDTIATHYDAVWVYGDPLVFDPVEAYGLPEHVRGLPFATAVASMAAAVGGTGVQRLAQRAELDLPDGQLCLCTVGGGEDGDRIAEGFARAELPAGAAGVIVTGPFMPAERRAAVEALVAQRDDMRVLPFHPDADTSGSLTRSVSMGGYNTVCELLACGRRGLVVPRVRPTLEQLVRDEALAGLGAVDLLEPHALTPDALSAWLAAGPRPPAPLALPIDIGGLERLPAMLDDVLEQPCRNEVLGAVAA